LNKEKEKLKLLMLSLPPDLIIIVCIIVSALLFVTGLFVPAAPWLRTFIFASCVILTGYDLVIDTVMKIIKEHDINGSLLIVAAAAMAFIIGRAAEGAAAILIFRTGEVLHNMTVKRSANVIENFVDLRPETVNAVINGAIVQMAPGKLVVGDIISISPGEHIALDGIVISGSSELDASALNGEAVPIPVTEGSEVMSGSVNLSGVLNIRITADFDNSTVSHILRIIKKAENRKAAPEKKIRKFARIYTPAIVASALILGVFIPVFGGFPLNPWLNRALGFLVVSNPTALVISVALTYFAGVGGASKKGIIFKGADVVDTAAHTTSVVFNKTGTLTDGIFRVIAVNASGIPERRLLMLAAYAELFSNHPIARSVVEAADIMPDFTRVSDYHEFTGKGTEIEIGGNAVSAGNELLMEELGVKPDISQSDSSVVYIAVNRSYAGRILLSDTVKNDSIKAVKDLHTIGIDRIVIFTGDRKSVAADVAAQLGIKEYYAECLPEDKFTRLKGLMDMQLAGDKLIFAGSGINDAPILKMADVGITLGGFRTDEVNDAADMIIMTDEPSKIAAAIAIARSTDKIVRQNVMLSLGFKGLILVLVMIGIASIWMAVLADVVFSMIVTINAMRAFGINRSEIRKILPKKSKEDEGYENE
jgi:Cd2+/Zn2+-exporting ATPase